MQQIHVQQNYAESHKHSTSLQRAKQCEVPWKSARLFKPCSVGAWGSMDPLIEHHARQIHPTLSREASLLLEKNEFSAKKFKSWKLLVQQKDCMCSTCDKDPGDVNLSCSPTATNRLCVLRQVILYPSASVSISRKQRWHLSYTAIWASNGINYVKTLGNYFRDTGSRKHKM